MAEVPGPLVGKGERVVGVFVFMIGAGLVLESRALWAGTLIALLGAAVFLWGLIVARPRSVDAVPAALPAGQQSEHQR